MYLRLILDAVGGGVTDGALPIKLDVIIIDLYVHFRVGWARRCVELGFAGAGQGSTRASRVSEQVKADLGFASGAVHDLAQR